MQNGFDCKRRKVTEKRWLFAKKSVAKAYNLRHEGFCLFFVSLYSVPFCFAIDSSENSTFGVKQERFFR